MGKSLVGTGLGTEDEGIVFDDDDVVTGTPLWRDNPFTDASAAAGTPDPVKTLSVSSGAQSIRDMGPLYRAGQPIPGTNAPGVGVTDMLPLLAVVGGGILAVLFLFKK